MAFMHQAWYWLLLWPALSFGAVSAAYFGLGPRIFGKREDGTLAPLRCLVLLPFLAHTYLAWRILRFCKSETAYDFLLPQVLIGRRLMPAELPPGIYTVVDLTCEFVEPRNIRSLPRYISFPLLDTGAADPAQLITLLRGISLNSAPLLIHCAEGHGRTGMVAAALLLVHGEATTSDEAIASVCAKRPAVRLKPSQERAVREVARILAQQRTKSGGNFSHAGGEAGVE